MHGATPLFLHTPSLHCVSLTKKFLYLLLLGIKNSIKIQNLSCWVWHGNLLCAKEDVLGEYAVCTLRAEGLDKS